MRLYFLFLLFLGKAAIGANHDFFVHPELEAQLDEPQQTIKLEESNDFILINGEKFYTGYHPSWEQYEGARFKKAFPVKTIPKEWSLRQMSYSPVRRQVNGDCWAQGNVSAFELTVNFADKVKKLFSVQDVIDCSGFGSAANGGQLSMKHMEKGAALESEYPYTGRDGKCKNPTRYEKAKRAFFLRGGSGKFPTLPEIQATMLELGALEVCGASSSLSSGGRQDTIRTGRTDHCYALTGWIDGKARGWLDTTYLEIKNSWGEGWGGSEKGYGYYPLAKADGVNLKGSVITEIQGVEYKSFAPPEPIEFVLESGKVTLKVKVKPTATYSVEDAKKALQSSIDSL